MLHTQVLHNNRAADRSVQGQQTAQDAVRVEEWHSMSAHLTHPTPYPDVNAVLHELLAGVQAILGDHFVGLYLHGSLAIGDFNPHRSDIDFVVVTAGELPDEMLPALEAMHAHGRWRFAVGGGTGRLVHSAKGPAPVRTGPCPASAY